MKYQVSITGALAALALTLAPGFTAQAAPVGGVAPLPAISTGPTAGGSQLAPLPTIAMVAAAPAAVTAQAVPAIPSGVGAPDVEVGDDINEIEAPEIEGIEVAEIETPDIEAPEVEAPEVETPELGE